MLKGYWKASGQFLKDKGKPLENAQKTHCQPIGEKADCPVAIGKKVAISIPFL
jgi:hypothetical protein